MIYTEIYICIHLYTHTHAHTLASLSTTVCGLQLPALSLGEYCNQINLAFSYRYSVTGTQPPVLSTAAFSYRYSL
jgi:hypothetical protein